VQQSPLLGHDQRVRHVFRKLQNDLLIFLSLHARHHLGGRAIVEADCRCKLFAPAKTGPAIDRNPGAIF